MNDQLNYLSILERIETSSLGELRESCAIAQKNGSTLFDLSMINGDVPPARELLDRFIEASLKTSTHRYTSAKGLLKLRDAFAEKYRLRFGVPDIDPGKHVCVTLGAKDAMLQVLSVLAEQANTVLLPSPTYPALRSAAELVKGFQLEYYQGDTAASMRDSACELIRKHPGSVLVLNTPHNPTGVILSGDDIAKIVHEAEKYNCYILNDFVYGEMGFHEVSPELFPEKVSPRSLLSVAPPSFPRMLEVYSMSKAYCIPGWRIAALVGDERLIEVIARRKSHSDYGTFVPLQVGAAAGLRSQGKFLTDHVRRCAERAFSVASGLSAIGCDVSPPQAGVSVWAKLPLDYQGSANEFAHKLVRESGVFVLPGDVFGKRYADYFRVALVKQKSVLEECVSRIGELFERAGVATKKATVRSDSESMLH